MPNNAGSVQTPVGAGSRKMLWAGRVVSAIPGLLILLGAIPKILKSAAVVEGFRQAGFSADLAVTVGAIEFVSAIVYLIPRTRVLGAILMTGVLGGAVATNLRIASPVLVAPALLGVLVWLGLFLRDQRLRTLIPYRNV